MPYSRQSVEINQRALAEAARLNDAARKRADKLGCTPKSAIQFSRLLGVGDDRVQQWISNAGAEDRDDYSPTPPIPDSMWMLSGKFRVWPIMVANAYKAARDEVAAARSELAALRKTAGKHRTTPEIEAAAKRLDALLAKPFVPPRVQVPDALTPMARADIARLIGKDPSTVTTWIKRGVFPEETWPGVGWAKGVIEAWNKTRTGAQTQTARASSAAQSRAARQLVQALKDTEPPLIEFDPDAGTVSVQGSTVTMDRLDVEALDSI